jgi:hypothetical protein
MFVFSRSIYVLYFASSDLFVSMDIDNKEDKNQFKFVIFYLYYQLIVKQSFTNSADTWKRLEE